MEVTKLLHQFMREVNTHLTNIETKIDTLGKRVSAVELKVYDIKNMNDNFDPLNAINNIMKWRGDELRKEKLAKIFETIQFIEDIGSYNRGIWNSIEHFAQLCQNIIPKTDSSWKVWWTQASDNISFDDIRRNTNDKFILEIVDNYLTQTSLPQTTGYFSIITDYIQKTPVEIVNEGLFALLNNEGEGKCRELQTLIREMGDGDPQRYIEDYYTYFNRNSENSFDVSSFVDSFLINDEWCMVDGDEVYKEPSNITIVCHRIKNMCSPYGYNRNVDYCLDNAEELKSTYAKVRNTLGWLYFGGRLVVNPTGAVMSLLL